MIYQTPNNSFQNLSNISDSIRALKRGSLAKNAQSMIQNAAQYSDSANQNSFAEQSAQYKKDWDNYSADWHNWADDFQDYDAAKQPLLTFVQDRFVDRYKDPTPTGFAFDSGKSPALRLGGHYGGYAPGREYNDELDASLAAINQYKADNFSQPTQLVAPTAPEFNWNSRQTQLADDPNYQQLERLNAEQRRLNIVNGARPGADLAKSGWINRVKADKMLSGVSGIAEQSFRQAQDARNAAQNQELSGYSSGYQDYLNNKGTWQSQVADQDAFDGNVGNDIPAFYSNVPTARNYGRYTPFGVYDVPDNLRQQYTSSMDAARGNVVDLLGQNGTVEGNRPQVTQGMFTGSEWEGPASTESLPATTPYKGSLSTIGDIGGSGSTFDYLRKLEALENMRQRFNLGR